MLKNLLLSLLPRQKRKDASFLFCTAYFNDMERYRHWIEYYREHMHELDVSHLILIDDGSAELPSRPDIRVIQADAALPKKLPPGTYVFTFRSHLGRLSLTRYPGWWRSFLFSWKIASAYGFRKIVHLESDCYALSETAFRLIRETNEGWLAPYCRVYGFPETAFQIICPDQFDKLHKLYGEGERFFMTCDVLAELILPFTRVDTNLMGDRFGEAHVRRMWPSLPPHPDYIANATVDFIRPYLPGRRVQCADPAASKPLLSI